jgi:hypothetical protein
LRDCSSPDIPAPYAPKSTAISRKAVFAGERGRSVAGPVPIGAAPAEEWPEQPRGAPGWSHLIPKEE